MLSEIYIELLCVILVDVYSWRKLFSVIGNRVKYLICYLTFVRSCVDSFYVLFSSFMCQ